MEKQKIYLEISEEIYRELAQKGIDLKQVLEQQNIGDKVTHEPSPFVSDDTVKIMDISMAIEYLAVGGSAWLILDRLNAILKTVLNRTTFYEAEKPMINPKTNKELKENGKIKTTEIKVHEPTVKNEKSSAFIDLIKAKFFLQSESTIKNGIDKKTEKE